MYDILGKEAAVLVNESLAPGRYETEFNGASFASGIYFYVLSENAYRHVRKMVLIR